MKKKVIYSVVIVVVCLLALGVLLMLIPVEQKRKMIEKYGQLAIDAETLKC